MTSLTWLDQRGNPLPRDPEGAQFIRLMGGRCGLLDVCVHASSTGVDAVELLGEHPEQLVDLGGSVFGRQTRSGRRMKREEDSWKAAGEMIAIGRFQGEEVARSRLAVLPANFSDAEYQRMLLEIGLTAVSSASWVQASVGARAVTPQRGKDSIGVSTAWGDVTLDALLTLINEFERALPTIRRRPLSTVRRESRVVPSYRAARMARGARRLVRRPGARNVSIEALSESFDSMENQFLRWVIEHQMLPLVQIELVGSEDTHSSRDEDLEQLVFPAAERNERLQDLASRLREADARGRDHSARRMILSDMKMKLAGWLSEAPLQRVSLVPAQVAPTERLLGTPGYRDVFHAFEQAQISLGHGVVKGLAIADAVLRREVGATWRCYETWCFAQIARAFGELGGFCTPPGERTLGEFLEIADREVRIPRSTPLVLCRGEVRVELQYEPSLPSSRDGKGRRLPQGQSKDLTPDFLVTIQRGRSKGQFVLDAKYRDYAKQGARTLVSDLWTTALLKYRDGLNTSPDPNRAQIAGSYILHSDPAARSTRNDFWGGVPAEEWLSSGALEELDEECLLVRGHACGIIRLRPDDDRDFQLGRLLDMWLQFHVPADGFECSRCGTALVVGSDVRMERRGKITDEFHEVNYINKSWREGWQTSVLCVCPTCSNYWFQNHCKASGHQIFKLGRRSYHEESRQPWTERGMYVCPECGDDPPREAFQERGHVRHEQERPPTWADDRPDEGLPF